MAAAVYDFRSYKDFLNTWLEHQPKRGHGLRRKIAEVIGTQTGFVTQVLAGSAHFSSEQVFSLAGMLGQSAEEIQFLQLLVQLERAGTKEFKKHIERQIDKVLEDRRTLTLRLKSQDFPSEVDQNRYFSSWLYACLHVMTTCERYQESKNSMADDLGLPREVVSEALEFLLRAGLVKEEKGLLKTGSARLHLGTDSPYLIHHHRNWNLMALQRVMTDYKTDVHYSSVVSLSSDDVDKVKEIYMRAIEESKSVVRESSGEKIFVTTLNFFRQF